MRSPTRRRAARSDILLLVVVLLASHMAFPSEAASLHSTFEEGEDGWALYGVVRIETDWLQGSYAMEGHDGSFMRRVVDLTGDDVLVMDVLFTGDDPRYLSQFVYLAVTRLDRQGNPIDFAQVLAGESLIATDDNPTPNPDRRLFDLTRFIGPHRVRVSWNQLACFPEDLSPCFEIVFPGMVDNITIPEPSSLLLGLASVAGMSTIGWRRQSRPARPLERPACPTARPPTS